MLRVLILDDDSNACEVIQDALLSEERGFEIASATKSKDAILLAQQATTDGVPFDVFLIDMRLGSGPDGIEMLRYLNRITPQADSIIFTGWENPEDGLRAFKAGAFRYLPKPVQIEELILTLETLSEWRKTRQERTWLRVFTELAEQALNCTQYEQAALVMLNGLLRLGFQTVRLFDFAELEPDILTGGYQAGEELIAGFESLTFPLANNPLLDQAIHSPEIYLLEQHGPGRESLVGYPNKSEITSESVFLPLRVGEARIGLLALENYAFAPALRPEERTQLSLVSRLVSGNLARMRLFEKEREDARRLDLLQRASVELLRIANMDEEKFWYTLLTLATADYGLGFNRAWLFLLEGGDQRLRGKLGIGQLDETLARKDWSKDRRERLDFDRFMTLINSGSLKRTPLEDLTRNLLIELKHGNEDNELVENAFVEVITSQKRVVLESDNFNRVPTQFTQLFQPSTCAILPIRAGTTVIGIAIVDNKHDHLPLIPGNLDRLETLVNISGLVWQNVVQRRLREAVQDTTYAILGNINRQPLKETLSRICETARTLTGADWVVIYPLDHSNTPLSFDLQNIGASGVFKGEEITNRPSPKGVSAYVMRSGLLMVNDVDQDDRLIGLTRLREHSFIHDKGIKSLIATPIFGMESGEQLGIMYLDFRTTQWFSPQESFQARTLANLASVAILNRRHTDQVGKSLQQAQQKGLANQRELEFLHRFLETTLAGSEQQETIRALLTNLVQALGQADFHPSIFLKRWEKDSRTGEPHEVPVGYCLGSMMNLVPASSDIFERVFIETIFSNKGADFRQHGKKIFQPIINQNETMAGVLCLELKRSSDFDEVSPILRRFSSAAALALDHVQYRYDLECVLEAAGSRTAPLDLKSFFQAVEQAVRKISPDLSAFTIWYKDPESTRIKYGYAEGVWNNADLMRENPDASSTVWDVIHAREPIFELNVFKNPLLSRKFAREEKIVSAGAFPLTVDDEEIGAMFLNYRQPHNFSTEEQSIFHILSDVVAVRIRDTVHLAAIDAEQHRLKTARDTSLAIGSTLDLNQVLEKVVSRLSEAFAESSILIALYNEDDNQLEFFANTLDYYPIDHPILRQNRMISLDERSIAGRIAKETLQNGTIIVRCIQDITADPDYFTAYSSTKSELCASLVIDKKLLGVIVLERPEVDGFIPEDIELVKAVAPQISLAIDRAQRSAQLNFKMAVATRLAWASELAHDFKHEVGNIRNYSYLISEAPNNQNDVARFASEIQAGAERLASNVPWYSEVSELPLDETVERWVKEYVQRRKETIEMVIDKGCPGLLIRCHPASLQIVIRHLVRNAAQAMENSEKRVLIVHTGRLEDEWVEIIFEDTGPGVDYGLRQQIFQKTIDKNDQGGSGLLLIRQLVEDMGGKIRLLPSPPGTGASFSIKIPLQFQA